METIRRELEQLCRTPGPAGQPEISRLAVELLRPLTDTVKTDAMGNVLAVRHGTDAAAGTVLLQAHMDEIGFLVTDVDDQGFVHVAAAGSPDERVLAAQDVVVYGKEPYTGIFCSVPPHLLQKDSGLPELSDRGIDLGMSAETARACVHPGDRVGFAPQFYTLRDTIVSGKALDDRAGMAAVLHALRILKAPAATVAIAFCVQEEVGRRGAGVAARQLKPDVALATDVSFALTPDANRRQCGIMGAGAMIGISPLLDRRVSDALRQLAEERRITHQFEVMGSSTGTDADMISKENSGIPTGLLSIPLRYMHTPVEAVDLRDIAQVGALMAAYITEKGGRL